MHRIRILGLALSFASLSCLAGCSDSSAQPIDTRSTIEKASGGHGTARQSAKGKAAAEEAVKKFPKLH